MSVYEEQEALRYANYNWTEWRQLPHWERAFHVAHYRLHKLVELHGSDAVNDKAERDRRAQEARARRKK